jgi:hypothetical protein
MTVKNERDILKIGSCPWHSSVNLKLCDPFSSTMTTDAPKQCVSFRGGGEGKRGVQSKGK